MHPPLIHLLGLCGSPVLARRFALSGIRVVATAILLLLGPRLADAAVVLGSLQTWHRIEIVFAGPQHAETDDTPNPFLDYRLQCSLTGPSGQDYEVAGFFDGGNLWKCRFAADEPGPWQYQASFRQGAQVAVSLDPAAGAAVAFDGESGSFQVAASVARAPDFRAPAHGFVENAGGHYLSFRGGAGVWLKGGSNIPENFLGYVGFDNTPAAGHAFAAHVVDWRPGDPDWNGGAGKAIIGALNYLAEAGGNSLYFLPMNVSGDGDDTYPTVAPQDKTHFDTSKLVQWEQVFTHADSLGVFLHIVLSEAELGNASYHDGGELGPQRKLFYRELVARFAHHLGMEWDLGEENRYGAVRHAQFASHLRALDAYGHPVTTHTRFAELEAFYAPLLGDQSFAMTAIQDGPTNLADKVADWRQRSADAGVPWVISVDEPHPIQNDPNDSRVGYPGGRKNFLWPVYLGGGGGFEWYVKRDGGGDDFDTAIEDFREMEVALRWTAYARAFVGPMASLGAAAANQLSTARYTLAAPGLAYAMYQPDGGAVSVDLSASTEPFTLRWFDPRSGQWHEGGEVSGGGWRDLGSPPFGDDAAVLVFSATAFSTTTTTTTVAAPTTTTPVATMPPGSTLPPVTTSTTTTTTLPPLDPCPTVSAIENCVVAARSRLDVRRVATRGTKLDWTWLRSAGTNDFGAPTMTTHYRLCVYDSVDGALVLEADLLAPAGERWRASNGGVFRYRHGDAGIERVRLKPRKPGGAKIHLRAYGAFLGASEDDGPTFDVEPLVAVRLMSSSGRCWSATYTEDKAKRNDSFQFKAKTP